MLPAADLEAFANEWFMAKRSVVQRGRVSPVDILIRFVRDKVCLRACEGSVDC